jgi:hypothetical protein
MHISFLLEDNKQINTHSKTIGIFLPIWRNWDLRDKNFISYLDAIFCQMEKINSGYFIYVTNRMVEDV